MRFASRIEAGQQLGGRLGDLGWPIDRILGLPRGGVIVAAEVARCLQCPLDTLVVRKIGHPHHRELAVGALAEPDIVVFDRETMAWSPPRPGELESVEREELQRLHRYQDRFHPHGPPQLESRDVLLVDDGLATGATMEAAVRGAWRLGAARVRIAVPVASSHALRRLRAHADSLLTLIEDPEFAAVGQYYLSFGQVGDDEVLAVLAAAD